MTSTTALGLCLGLGSVTVWLRLPTFRRARLADRVLPYVSPRSSPAFVVRRAPTHRSGSDATGSTRRVRRAVETGARRLDAAVGGSASVERRLDRAGRALTRDTFRAEQVVWGLVGALLALVAGLLLGGGQSRVLLPSLVLAGLGFTGGVMLRDRALSREVGRRQQRLVVEFPTAVELLALAVSAGEGTTAAIERVAARGRGAFAEELARVAADVRSGRPVAGALAAMAERVDLPEFHRFVDAVCVALERGTPLADVIRAQAGDARESGRRALIEAGGRKEIAMMVPVVFLVLPVSVVFALFPGFYGLSLGSP
jgi:tight adherence protein C